MRKEQTGAVNAPSGKASFGRGEQGKTTGKKGGGKPCPYIFTRRVLPCQGFLHPRHFGPDLLPLAERVAGLTVEAVQVLALDEV